mgnify:CR=1 FL=1
MDTDKLNNPYTYDPEGAKKLLDDAGIVDTDGDGIREIDGENINLHYVSYENRLLNDFSNAHIQYRQRSVSDALLILARDVVKMICVRRLRLLVTITCLWF